MVMFKNPKGEIKSMLEMVVDTKSGIRLIYKGKSTGKREEAPASIQNQAASTTLGDIDALAALKEQMEAGKK